MDEFERSLAGLDVPAELPGDVRARLEAALLDPLAGLDGPVPLPLPLRERLVAAVANDVAPRRGRVGAYWLAAAAAIVLIAASLTAVALSGGTTTRSVASHVLTPTSSVPTTTQPIAGNFGAAANGTQDRSAATPLPALAAPSASGSAGVGTGGGVVSGTTTTISSSAPPFAFSSGPFNESGSNAAAPAGAAELPHTDTTTTAPPAPLRIGLVRGDPAEEAGFAAYEQILNNAGGVSGRQVLSIAVTPGTAAAGTVATVNLSGAPIASAAAPPAWATGPVLETLLAPDAALHGRVYDVSSSADRQAHLAANALFPTTSVGATAVIYRAPSGVLSDVVPNALLQVLRARGVTATLVTYQPGQAVVPLGDEAAFLSLSPSAAHAWAQAAHGLAFPRGVAGVGDLLDPTLRAVLPTAADVVSPYQLPGGPEADVLTSALGGPFNAEELHGWETAKVLAVALWQSGATTAAGLQAALDAFAGYSDGLLPPYHVRPGTNSRTPEGLLFTTSNGQFVAIGSFRTDPF